MCYLQTCAVGRFLAVRGAGSLWASPTEVGWQAEEVASSLMAECKLGGEKKKKMKEEIEGPTNLME